jgi:hypothetical protein
MRQVLAKERQWIVQELAMPVTPTTRATPVARKATVMCLAAPSTRVGIAMTDSCVQTMTPVQADPVQARRSYRLPAMIQTDAPMTPATHRATAEPGRVPIQTIQAPVTTFCIATERIRAVVEVVPSTAVIHVLVERNAPIRVMKSAIPAMCHRAPCARMMEMSAPTTNAMVQAHVSP